MKEGGRNNIPTFLIFFLLRSQLGRQPKVTTIHCLNDEDDQAAWRFSGIKYSLNSERSEQKSEDGKNFFLLTSALHEFQ